MLERLWDSQGGRGGVTVNFSFIVKHKIKIKFIGQRVEYHPDLGSSCCFIDQSIITFLNCLPHTCYNLWVDYLRHHLHAPISPSPQNKNYMSSRCSTPYRNHLL